jgi:hypothetical protein
LCAAGSGHGGCSDSTPPEAPVQATSQQAMKWGAGPAHVPRAPRCSGSASPPSRGAAARTERFTRTVANRPAPGQGGTVTVWILAGFEPERGSTAGIGPPGAADGAQARRALQRTARRRDATRRCPPTAWRGDADRGSLDRVDPVGPGVRLPQRFRAERVQTRTPGERPRRRPHRRPVPGHHPPSPHATPATPAAGSCGSPATATFKPGRAWRRAGSAPPTSRSRHLCNRRPSARGWSRSSPGSC